MSEKEKNRVPFTKAGLQGKSDEAPKSKADDRKTAKTNEDLPKMSKDKAEDKSDDKPAH